MTTTACMCETRSIGTAGVRGSQHVWETAGDGACGTSAGSGPGHVPPRLVTDVERWDVTRCTETTGCLDPSDHGVDGGCRSASVERERRVSES